MEQMNSFLDGLGAWRVRDGTGVQNGLALHVLAIVTRLDGFAYITCTAF